MVPLYKFRLGDSPGSDWDRKYAEESLADLENYRAQPFVRTILRHLPVRSRVLDAGCGTGGLLRFLKQRGAKATGIDSSPVAIGILRRLAPDVPAQVASIEALPFPDASFDAYLAIGSWEYPMEGPERAAREAARVLTPNGLAFIEIPYGNVLRRFAYFPLKRLEYVVKTAVGKSPLRAGPRPGRWSPQFAHHVFTREELEELLREHHLEILEVQPHDLPESDRHYGLWVDWPFFRAGPHYELNGIGKIAKALGHAISPWTIATGMFIVARKK